MSSISRRIWVSRWSRPRGTGLAGQRDVDGALGVDALELGALELGLRFARRRLRVAHDARSASSRSRGREPRAAPASARSCDRGSATRASSSSSRVAAAAMAALASCLELPPRPRRRMYRLFGRSQVAPPGRSTGRDRPGPAGCDRRTLRARAPIPGHEPGPGKQEARARAAHGLEDSRECLHISDTLRHGVRHLLALSEHCSGAVPEPRIVPDTAPARIGVT